MTSRNQQINSLHSRFSLDRRVESDFFFFFFSSPHPHIHGMEWSRSWCLAGNNHFVQVTGCRLWTSLFFFAALGWNRLHVLGSTLMWTLSCVCCFTFFFCSRPAATTKLLQTMRIHFSPPFISYFMCLTPHGWLGGSLESDEIYVKVEAHSEAGWRLLSDKFPFLLRLCNNLVLACIHKACKLQLQN